MATKKSTSKKPAARKAATRTSTRKAAVKKAPTKKAAARPGAKSAGKKKAAARPTAKKAKARAVPKVSPARGSSILKWVEQKMEAWQQEVFHAIHALIRKEAPAAEAFIKWAQPVFEEGGPFAFVRAAREHVTLGFWRGGELKDPKKLLEGAGSKMKHIKLKNAKDVKRPEIVAFVREAVKLNRQKGDPTRG